MIPKEKAEELVLKYLRVDNNTKEWFNTYISKQCALIAVKEIEESGNKLTYELLDGYVDVGFLAYWKVVKQEIEKL